MSLKAKVLRGAFWTFVQSWGTQFGSLSIFFLLARLLTPEAFGLVALASVFLAFMQAFLSQGFADAIVQRDHLEPAHLDAAFWTGVVLGTGLMVLEISTSQLIATFFDTPQLAPVLCWFSPLLLIKSLSTVHQAKLQRQFAFKSLAIRNIAGVVSGGLVGLVMALNQFGVWALVGQQLAQELVATIVLWWTVDWRPNYSFSPKHWQELLAFGLHQAAFSLMNFMNTRADDFLIGYYLGPISLGYYSLAYRILTAMTDLLVNSSNQLALPTFSRLKDDLEQFQRAFCQATKLSSTLAFPAFVSVAILAPELITTLFGEKWKPSIPILQILVFVGALRSVTYFKGAIFLAMGKPAWRLRLGMLTSLLNILGFFIAVQWGILEVAWAYLTCSLIMFPISQGVVSQFVKVQFRQYLQQFTTSVVSTLVMAAVMWLACFLLKDVLAPIGVMVIALVIGASVYGLAIYRFEPELVQKIWLFLPLGSKKAKPHSL